MNLKIAIFWDSEPCSPYMNRRFGGKFHLHFQGRKSAEQEINESRWVGKMSSQSFCLANSFRWFPARLIFDPEDGGETFLRNVGSYTDYTVLYPRRWQFAFS
jgi:hypothetical protein